MNRTAQEVELIDGKEIDATRLPLAAVGMDRFALPLSELESVQEGAIHA